VSSDADKTLHAEHGLDWLLRRGATEGKPHPTGLRKGCRRLVQYRRMPVHQWPGKSGPPHTWLWSVTLPNQT